MKKFEVSIIDGRIVFDLDELFSNMTEDELKAMVSRFSLYAPLVKELVETIRLSYYGPFLNQDIYEIAKGLFTYEGEDDLNKHYTVEAMRSAMRKMFRENLNLYRKTSSLEIVLHKFLEKIREDFGNECANQYRNDLNQFRDKLALKDLDDGFLEHLIGDQWVQKWCEVMTERFKEVDNATKNQD